MAQSFGFDRRRVNGPEVSYHPIFEPISGKASSASTPHAGLKRVGRTPKEIRPIFLKTGLINQANGSAYIETEKTKIACAVYGPRQNKNLGYSEKGKLNVEVKFAPFSCTRRRAPMRDVEDRATSVLIHQSLLPSLRLELFPKSTIDIFITILECDGMEGCVASGSVAASAALADAGIEMLGLVAACSACVFDSDDNEVENNEPWVDPNEEESGAASGTVVMACMPALGTLTNVSQVGSMSASQLGSCMDRCLERSMDIHMVMSKALLESSIAGDKVGDAA